MHIAHACKSRILAISITKENERVIRRMKKKIFVRYLLPPSTEQISIFNRLFQEHYQNVKIFHFYLYVEKQKKKQSRSK